MDYDRTYPTTAAALIAGVSPKVVRNWIDRDQLFFLQKDVDARREGSEWRRFSIWNVMHLAVTRQLADIGVPVNRAAFIAFGMFRTVDISDLSNGRISQNEFVRRMDDRTIFLWRNGDKWDGKYLRSRPKQAPAIFITADTSTVVREVFDKLDELDAEG